MGEQKLHEFQENLKQLIDFNTNKLLTDFGSKMYDSNENFTFGRIYEIAGRDDCVMNITFYEGTALADKYPNGLTCLAQYFQKDRKILETDFKALDDRTNIQVKNLLVLKENVFVAIDLNDIDSILVLPNFDVTNTFNSKELRHLKFLEVSFNAEGGGKDIFWMYGFLKKLVGEEVALSPEEHAEYLAYKIVLEHEGLSETERKEIFNEDGQIVNQRVGYYFLLWKKSTGKFSEKHENELRLIRQNLFYERFAMLKTELKKIGLSIEKMKNEYPNQLNILIFHLFTFTEKRYSSGKYLLYLNFEGMLHIYLRHVNELSINKQFADRDKFQLVEKDIFTTMNVLLTRMNDDYQQWKENNPNKRYHWFGPRTYYNGDYYEVYVNEDGSISTFFKCSHNKK